ncbi:hypothetical protein BDV27DRAFT_130786 [Aspergillus caelatus]|uniref:Secreted protein n=2 Tax=Aspergillus subgen. Circumdati TaxID=2720871 RepID=A0A5N7A080_9EURO|nr:uncharacterized protein BDV27DRAFT_130786 [Aspergillus caelatus]KAE8362888.1 hypothetical protein BDV27DRAFT_130786 [Aspergillus caelatus]KAE8420776.1 hypothetical protein BDV36DRAFT_249122 [Aspergillus pseudocaelatus]
MIFRIVRIFLFCLPLRAARRVSPSDRPGLHRSSNVANWESTVRKVSRFRRIFLGDGDCLSSDATCELLCTFSLWKRRSMSIALKKGSWFTVGNEPKKFTGGLGDGLCHFSRPRVNTDANAVLVYSLCLSVAGVSLGLSDWHSGVPCSSAAVPTGGP